MNCLENPICYKLTVIKRVRERKAWSTNKRRRGGSEKGQKNEKTDSKISDFYQHHMKRPKRKKNLEPNPQPRKKSRSNMKNDFK